MPRGAHGNLVLTEDLSTNLSETSLFYPCAGSDWKAALALFVPYLSRYWFVDVGYREPMPRPRLGALADRFELVGCPRTEHPDLVPADLDDRYYRVQRPFVCTAELRPKESPRTIAVRWYMRRGPSALRNLSERLGVFFYRGDSSEGGSGTWWLGRSDSGGRGFGQMLDVLDRLVEGGLIVTDGSNGRLVPNSNPYCELSRFLGDYDADPAEACRSAQSFHVDGRVLRCIGYVDRMDPWDKGPTLVWQVLRARHDNRGD